ncbi:hypothetical protein HMPREF1548_00166 [Clostridium sp. KLE 1755]|jgi:hypothetical protein|nr:hypothetical protein HMPREF1548_00166 [Clostridium sp. KLE 1755]
MTGEKALRTNEWFGELLLSELPIYLLYYIGVSRLKNRKNKILMKCDKIYESIRKGK